MNLSDVDFDFENYSNFRNFPSRLEFDIIFVFVSIILLFVSLLAFTFEFLLLLSLFKENLVPVNVKIILINLTGACLVLSIALSCQAVMNLIFQCLQYPPVSLFQCSVLQSIRIISGSAVLSFALIMGIERFIASRRAILGKNQTKLSTIVISLIVITWLWSLVNMLVLLIRNYSLANAKLCICDILLLAFPNKVFITYIEVYVPIEIALVVSFWAFWLYQRKILKVRGMNTAQHNLAERMTILESITLTNTLLPTISLHAVCNVLYATFIIVGYIYLSYFNNPWGVNCIQVAHLFNALYCVLNPLVVFRMNSTLTKSMSNINWINILIDIFIDGGVKWKSRKEKKYYIDESKPKELESHVNAEEHNEVKLQFDKSNDIKVESISEHVEIKEIENIPQEKRGTIIVVKPLSDY